MIKRKPTHPRSFSEWKAGSWPDAPGGKARYAYAPAGKDSLTAIAARLKGRASGDPAHSPYADDLCWQDLALLNFATDDPGEINWYLDHFNGCRSTTSDGKHHLLTRADARPFLWVPTAMVFEPLEIRVPRPAPPVTVHVPPPISEVTARVRERFRSIDIYKDGFLDKRELTFACESHSFTGADAAAIVALRENLSRFEDLSDDELGPETSGITFADLDAYDRLKTSDANHELVRSVEAYYSASKAKISAVGSELFVGEPSPFSVYQGFVGDCWLLATLVGLAHRDPSDVKRLVAPEPDREGFFRVNFPGRPPMVVKTPTAAEIAIFASTRGNGLWLTVLECAYGITQSMSALEGADGGEMLSKGIQVVTGHDSDDDTLSFTSMADLRTKLLSTIGHKRIITCSIRGSFQAIFGRSEGILQYGWPMGHAYTVLGYDRQTDVITVRNPWGTTGPQGATPVEGGGYALSLTDFDKIFTAICFEEGS